MHFYLVTTHRHESFVGALLESLRNQYTSLTEFHQTARVLVVDDASSDGTVPVLRSFADKNPNVEVFVNPRNKGIGYNRNFLLNWFSSLSPSAQDFLLFVDGDDLLPKGSMDTRLAVLEADPSLQVVGGQLGVFYGTDVSKVDRVNTFPLDPQVQAIANLFECHFYVSNALFRASVFMDPVVRFPETPTSEDWLFFALHPLRKRHVPEVTLHYRRHDNNLTSLPASQEMVVSLRRQARSLVLLRAGLLPSARDCELLDIVGYLSFRLQWCGDCYQPRPEVKMPWFNLLSNRPDIKSQWPAIRRELSDLFSRIIEHNDRVPGFDRVKLRAYFAAILESAQREIGQPLSVVA